MKLYHGTDLLIYSAQSRFCKRVLILQQGEKDWTLVQGSMLRLD